MKTREAHLASRVLKAGVAEESRPPHLLTQSLQEWVNIVWLAVVVDQLTAELLFHCIVCVHYCNMKKKKKKVLFCCRHILKCDCSKIQVKMSRPVMLQHWAGIEQNQGSVSSSAATFLKKQ